MADTDGGMIAGFVILAIVLLLIVAGIIVAVYLVIKKLRFQHDEILKLNTRIDELAAAEQDNRGYEHEPEVVVSRTKLKGEFLPDSGVDIRDSSSVSTSNGNSVHGNVGGHDVNTRSHHGPPPIIPEYNIKVRNRKTLMFGAKAAMPQVVSLAQNFVRAIGGDADVAPVDEIDITGSDQSDTTGTLSPLSRQSVWQGRPTSILMQTPQVVPDSPTKPVSHDKGVFVHKSVGKEGDTLSMSGVTLEIPPGAMSESKLITLGITWDEDFIPRLKKNQACLSPVVVCQPCIRFAKPVKLTFPHCAVDMIKDWIPRVLKRQGNLNDEAEWTNLTLDDYEERDVSLTNVSISLKHFTLYTLIGESKPDKTAVKKVKLVAFTQTLTQGAMFKSRIYCINDYDAEIKDIGQVEKTLKGSLSNAPVPLLFHDNGENLTVTLTTELNDWNVCGERTQNMDFESVWHALTPHCHFVFDPCSKSVSKIYCEFESHQQTVGRKVSVRLAAEHVQQASKLSPSTDPRMELDRKLIILLDPKSDMGAGDFRDLATKMDMDYSHVHYLESQTNPTEQLLKQWRGENRSLAELKKVLVDINRLDAAKEVELYISQYLTS